MLKKTALDNRNAQVNNLMRMKEPETNWGELENIYLTAAHGIVSTMQPVLELANFPGMTNYLENPIEFKVALDGFNRDMNMFTDKLVAIHNLHAHLKGPVSGPDEVAKSFAIYGEYAQFFEEFKSLTFQTVLSITEAASTAIQKMKATNVIQSAPITQTNDIVEVPATTTEV